MLSNLVAIRAQILFVRQWCIGYCLLTLRWLIVSIAIVSYFIE